jgi:hypothetical protein
MRCLKRIVPIVALLYAQVELHAFKQPGLRSAKSNKSKQLKESGQLEKNVITNLSFEKANQLRVFLKSDQARELFDKQPISKKNSFRDKLRSLAKGAEEFGTSSGTTKPKFVDNKTFFIFRSENLWDCLFYKGISFPDDSTLKIKEYKYSKQQNTFPSIKFSDANSLYNTRGLYWNFPVIDSNLKFRVYSHEKNRGYFKNGKGHGRSAEFRNDSLWHQKGSIHAKIGPDFINPSLLVPNKIDPNISIFSGLLYSSKWWKVDDTIDIDYDFKAPAIANFLANIISDENDNSRSIVNTLSILGINTKLSKEDYQLIYNPNTKNATQEDINRLILNSEVWHIGKMFQKYKSDYANTLSFYLIGPLYLNGDQVKNAQNLIDVNNKIYLKQFTNSFKGYYEMVENKLILKSNERKNKFNKLEISIANRVSEYKSAIDNYIKNLDIKSETKKAPIIKGLYLGQSIQDAKDALAKIGIESEIQFSENMKLGEIRTDLIENYLLKNNLNLSQSQGKVLQQKTNLILEDLGVKVKRENRSKIPNIKSALLLKTNFTKPNALEFLNLFGTKTNVEFDKNGRINEIVLGPKALNKLYNIRPDMELSFIAEQFVENIDGLNELKPFYNTESNTLFNNASIESGYKHVSKKGFIFTLSEITKIGTGLFDGKGVYLHLKKIKTLNFD